MEDSTGRRYRVLSSAKLLVALIVVAFCVKVALQKQEPTPQMERIIENVIEMKAPAPSIEDELPPWAIDEVTPGDAIDVPDSETN